MDKSLNITLAVLFGISGMAIVALAWMQTMPTSERVLSTIIGSVGLLVALARTTRLKFPRIKAGDGQVPVEVEVKERP